MAGQEAACLQCVVGAEELVHEHELAEDVAYEEQLDERVDEHEQVAVPLACDYIRVHNTRTISPVR